PHSNGSPGSTTDVCSSPSATCLRAQPRSQAGGAATDRMARAAPHVLFAPRAARRCTQAIQETAGHATLRMTLRCMHRAPGAHREAVALLDRRRSNSVATDER